MIPDKEKIHTLVWLFCIKRVLCLTLSLLVAIFIVCWQPLQIVWTQIRPDKKSGLIWIQPLWYSDGFPDRIFFFFFKVNLKKIHRRQNAKLPSMQRVKLTAINLVQRQPVYYCTTVEHWLNKMLAFLINIWNRNNLKYFGSLRGMDILTGQITLSKWCLIRFPVVCVRGGWGVGSFSHFRVNSCSEEVLSIGKQTWSYKRCAHSPLPPPRQQSRTLSHVYPVPFTLTAYHTGPKFFLSTTVS